MQLLWSNQNFQHELRNIPLTRALFPAALCCANPIDSHLGTQQMSTSTMPIYCRPFTSPIFFEISPRNSQDPLPNDDYMQILAIKNNGNKN